MEKRIFGLTQEKLKRQVRNTHAVDPESKMCPINPNDVFLEPCIRGAKKILSDSRKRRMLYIFIEGKPV